MKAQASCMSSRHETYPLVVLMRPFYNCWDFCRFLCPVNWIMWISGNYFLWDKSPVELPSINFHSKMQIWCLGGYCTACAILGTNSDTNFFEMKWEYLALTVYYHSSSLYRKKCPNERSNSVRGILPFFLYCLIDPRTKFLKSDIVFCFVL